MDQVKVFISYSHADEWLKNELLKHLAALKHREVIDIWHDRLIPAGGIIDDQIDSQIRSANVILLLVSNDFIASDYCFNKEYAIALERRDAGEAIIVPVIVRDCDWDAKRLKTFNALPPDALPVTRNAGKRDEAQERDAAWVTVTKGLQPLIEELKKKLEPPTLDTGYKSELFINDKVKHPLLSRFDESLVFVDPDIYLERGNKQVVDLDGFLRNAASTDAVVFVGPDQSGRTLIAKKIQELLTLEALPSVLLNAKEIRNSDVISIVRRAMRFQLGSVDFPLKRVGVIIDDFDECNLPDKIKENIIERLNKETRQTVIVSFSNAPCVLFTSRSLPDPMVFNIHPFTDDKLFILVKKWKSVGAKNEAEVGEQDILTAYSQLQMVFSQTEAPKSPCIAIMYLQLLETSSGADIAFSSYSACYDSMINNRLHAHGVDWRAIDECKNFLSLIAYSSYSKSKSSLVDRETYDDCLTIFEEQYLSDPKTLKVATLPVFFREIDGQLSFIEDYLWFFLCARYVAIVLRANEAAKYREFVTECTKNIFEKKFANIVIFIAYFSSDNFVLESLIGVLDGLFSKADDWLLSDDTREIMLGFRPADHLQIESKADVEQNRLSILREKISDIVDNAVKVVALYTLPFLKSDVADSVYVETVDVYSIDSESYMRNVNALLRVHSVMGQILTGRSGTYSTNLVLDAISRMVKASGRYASLNHAIATVLIYDQDQSKTEIGKALRKEIVSNDQYEKVLRIFSFWSVYLSHAGLARYLSQAHSIRALQKLASYNETEEHASENGNIPFNFTVVLMIAQLYEKGSVDKKGIEDALQKYGEHSSLFGILRVVFHIYTYYMPMKIEDKQWLSNKLSMSLSKLEIQRLKASDTKRIPRR